MSGSRSSFCKAKQFTTSRRGASSAFPAPPRARLSTSSLTKTQRQKGATQSTPNLPGTPGANFVPAGRPSTPTMLARARRAELRELCEPRLNHPLNPLPIHQYIKTKDLLCYLAVCEFVPAVPPHGSSSPKTLWDSGFATPTCHGSSGTGRKVGLGLIDFSLASQNSRSVIKADSASKKTTRGRCELK